MRKPSRCLRHYSTNGNFTGSPYTTRASGTANVHTNPGNTDVGVDIDVFAMPIGARVDFD